MSKSRKKKTGSMKEPPQEPATAEFENTGNYLRTLRMGKGLSVKDVTEATRISETNLNAIEDQNFSALPADTFTRGLLNIYGNFLGVDTEKVTARFMKARENFTSQKRRSRPKPPRTILKPKRLAEPSHISSITMAGILLLLIIVSFTGYCLYTSWNPFTFLMNEKEDIESVMKNVFPEEKSDREDQAGVEVLAVPAQEFPLEIVTEPSPAQAVDEQTSSEETEKAKPESPAEEQESLVQTAGTKNAANGMSESTTPGSDEDKPGTHLQQNPPAEAIDPVPAEAPAKPEAAAAKFVVTVRFLKDTVITLTRDGDTPTDEKYRAGDIETWTAESSLIMTFARSNSASIVVNDVDVAFPNKQDGSNTLHIPQDLTETGPDE